ncbi:glutaredoxin family protein [Pseudothauera lacus]|uniref:Glutaredoxin family protein n=1 Tax=Pseudothauera lacus TaxID=2136175 RepID=A0A2T4IHL3_9RHOO|nr:glutaredoxin family protein [Pseudothauera lacus]PTD97216.1 glutaredoxin family protein [Pseudothauera lacus]
MKRLLLLTALLTATPALLAQGTTYRWVDEQGRVHYSDQPPPQQVRQVEERRFVPRSADQVPAYTVSVAADTYPVTLYVSETCGDPCQRAKAYLDGRGVPYTERVLRNEEDVAAYRAALGEPEEIPAITVGHLPFKGFLESSWARLLDDAGYPRSAPPMR